VTAVTAPWSNRPYSYTLTGKGAAMRHISVIIVSALLLATAVDVITAGAKMGAARNHLYTSRVTGISVALPSGMKDFPVELPQ
jgi:hypothetical protein